MNTVHLDKSFSSKGLLNNSSSLTKLLWIETILKNSQSISLFSNWNKERERVRQKDSVRQRHACKYMSWVNKCTLLVEGMKMGIQPYSQSVSQPYSQPASHTVSHSQPVRWCWRYTVPCHQIPVGFCYPRLRPEKSPSGEHLGLICCYFYMS